MFEKLLKIDVEALDQNKVALIINNNIKEDPKTFSDIVTYVSVVYAAQQAGFYKDGANNKQSLNQKVTEDIVNILIGLVKGKKDPAFKDLNELLDSYNQLESKSKSTKKLPSNAFGWSLQLMNVIFKITNASEKNLAMDAYKTIAQDLNYSMKTIDYMDSFLKMLKDATVKGATEFEKTIKEAEQAKEEAKKEAGQAKQEAEEAKQAKKEAEQAKEEAKKEAGQAKEEAKEAKDDAKKAKAEAEVESARAIDLAKESAEIAVKLEKQKLELAKLEIQEVTKKAEMAQKEVDTVKQEVETTKAAKTEVEKKLKKANKQIETMTNAEMSMKSFVLEGASRRQTESVKAGSVWRSAVIYILDTLRTGYDECIADEKRYHSDTNAGGALNSLKILALIVHIASEDYKNENKFLENMITRDIKNYKKANGKPLSIVNTFSYLHHNGWLNNINGEDPLSGFEVTQEMIDKDDKEGIKKVYFKVSLLANMFGNKDNNSFLPYHAVEAKKYSEKVLLLQNKYTFVKRNEREAGTDVTSAVVNSTINHNKI
ncbi:MAG: hypothetical protein WC748_09750 [Legionellales bacterium]|jgi:hypothetical protein